MKLGTTIHPKFRRFAKLLGVPQYAAVGLLESIWMMACQFADDGDLSRFSAEELADYCGWEGDADSLLDTLVATKWIDRDADSLRIHDWETHCPDYVLDRQRKRRERRGHSHADADSAGDCPVLVQDIPGQSETVGNNLEKSSPSQAQPSLAKPSQTKPNQQQLASLPLAADLDGFLLAGDDSIDEIRGQANKLLKAFPSIDKVAIWRVAWIGFCLDRGLPSDLVERVRGSDKPIRKPLSYMQAVLRAELAKRGLDFDLLQSRVKSPPAVREVVPA